MMKKILMSVYAVCALLVIIGSLLWFVFTLHSDSTAGKTEALKNFKVFAQHTGEILSEAAQEGNPARLQLQLEQLCRNYSKYIQAIVIRDNAGIVFIWPKTTDIFSYNEEHIVKVKNLPLFVTAAQTHIPIKETDHTVTVHAALQMIPLETVFNRGQIVFFLLLIIVLMTVLVLIFSYIDLKPAEKKSERQNAAVYTFRTDTPSADSINSNTAQPDGYAAAAAEHKEEPLQPAETFAKMEAPSPVQNEAEAVRTKIPAAYEKPAAVNNAMQTPLTESSLPLDEQLESLNRLHIYDDEQSKRPLPHYQTSVQPTQLNTPTTNGQSTKDTGTEEAASPYTAQTDSSKMPELPQADAPHAFSAGNYGSFENHTQPQKTATTAQEPAKRTSTVTTFENTLHSDAAQRDSHSLEQATLIEELTNAITETAAAEEDLTLLLIHADDIPHNQHVIHLLRSTLDRIHKVFTLNKDILGVIVFYASLDQAMQIASTLYDEIHALLEDPTKKTLGIGLTTRAGRLIPAPRMIEEAMAAIGKATQEGGDPIVAFRVNPDKYRRCLARLS